MKTDTLFYRLFQEFPACYFELIGRPDEEAERYDFTSEELKQSGLRIDGVLVPKFPGDPVHFLEVMFYRTPNVYSNLFAKVFLWLEKKDPTRDWQACVLFGSRSLEPSATRPYRALLNSDQVVRIYLDELPPPTEDQFGLGVLEVLRAAKERAVDTAKTWLRRVRSSDKPPEFQRHVIELLETAILCHFPRLTRKELAAMVEVHDVRQTRIYQEALEEGRQEGRQEGREEGREEARVELALRLLREDNFTVAKVAELTGLSVSMVRRLKKKNERE